MLSIARAGIARPRAGRSASASTRRSGTTAARSRSSTPRPSSARRSSSRRSASARRSRSRPEHHFMREVMRASSTSGTRCRCARWSIGLTSRCSWPASPRRSSSDVIHGPRERRAWFGAFAALQGVGSIVGGITAGSDQADRRVADGRARACTFGICGRVLAVPSLPVVALAFTVAGVGVVWLIVGPRRRSRRGRRSRSRDASRRRPTSRSPWRRRSRSRPARALDRRRLPDPARRDGRGRPRQRGLPRDAPRRGGQPRQLQRWRRERARPATA